MPEGERSEAATPRHLQELKKGGDVVRSAEFNTAVGLLAGALTLRFVVPMVVEKMGETLSATLQHPNSFGFNDGALQFMWIDQAINAGMTIVPLMLAVVIAGIASNLIQVGMMFNPSLAAPKGSRINPLEGTKRLFSLQGFSELAKSGIKLLIIGGVIYHAIQDQQGAILNLIQRDVMGGASWFAALAADVMIRVGVVFLVLAAADYMFQRWQHLKRARMTKEQVKEELKSAEGNPQMKARMRQFARTLAMSRMMRDVQTADVIITNPTHLAVAIKYEMGSRAPRVVAKGPNLLAERIKQLAREKSIPIIENRPLAQALYKAVEVGQEVPAQLFQVVAEVLAFVYRLKAPRTNIRGFGGSAPDSMRMA